MAPAGVERLEQVEDRLAVDAVEVARRLVGEHDGGMADERPGDRDPLALTS